jgi:DNA topoisomerase IA
MEADLKLICEGQKSQTDVLGHTIDMYRSVLIRAQNESIKLEQVESSSREVMTDIILI